MKNANEIYKENLLTVEDMMRKGAAKKVKYLIWLGQVEVIDRLVKNEQQKLELLREIKI